MNDTFLKACRGEQTPYTPVWFMRQAGRYLPEYQKIRSKVSFLELCKRPELCTEVTLQPVDIFGFDAAILFSDILIPMEAMGLALEFHEGRGPVFPQPVRDRQAVDALVVPDPKERVPFVMETIRLLRRALQVPLIGFAGAPFTLATYLIEGGSSRVFLHTKKMMFQEPELYHDLLEKITACTSSYLQAQARAGAQALQLFDSWAGILAPCDYEQFALPYVQSIIADLRAMTDIPLIYFANNGATLTGMTVTAGADVLGFDWRLPIGEAIQRAGDHAVQGNLDPLALFLPADRLEQRVKGMLSEARAARGYIFNLGHGIQPETPPDQVRIVVDAVHRHSGR
ncbi:uroporphyrinogen decarboxylase [Desulfobulbus alkaliphilus]|uniref:uroporphyrinogen decarboxylase n=1 Tax=Desulfobulbus alkaliphilus TaxID=869814 RepID=UPI0019645673|nr:uroporphyrinogen decarboxylase [Desulfobulbus alkaliphilus]MBM9538041.1 uroporphyrinogen decarboxylase [Desulfobulbus alkaliphilus]